MPQDPRTRRKKSSPKRRSIKNRRTPSFLRASTLDQPPTPRPQVRRPVARPQPRPVAVVPAAAAAPAAAPALIIRDRSEKIEKITEKGSDHSALLYALAIFFTIIAVVLFIMGMRKGGNCTKKKRCRVKHSYNTAEIMKSACGGEGQLSEGYCQGNECPIMKFGDKPGTKAAHIEDLSTVMIEKLKTFEFDPKKFGKKKTTTT